MSGQYEAVRSDEHKTLGDSYRDFTRDSKAFEAGAQHVLDRLMGEVDRHWAVAMPTPHLEHLCARLLRDVQQGKL